MNWNSCFLNSKTITRNSARSIPGPKNRETSSATSRNPKMLRFWGWLLTMKIRRWKLKNKWESLMAKSHKSPILKKTKKIGLRPKNRSSKVKALAGLLNLNLKYRKKIRRYVISQVKYRNWAPNSSNSARPKMKNGHLENPMRMLSLLVPSEKKIKNWRKLLMPKMRNWRTSSKSLINSRKSIRGWLSRSKSCKSNLPVGRRAWDKTSNPKEPSSTGKVQMVQKWWRIHIAALSVKPNLNSTRIWL